MKMKNILFLPIAGLMLIAFPAYADGHKGKGPEKMIEKSDINGDGYMDLYVGNMFSSAGNRITRQAMFRTGDDARTKAIYSRFAKGNTLFSGSDTGKFLEMDASIGVEMGRWAWSSLFADMNNDGWQDLLVANGHVSGVDTNDL